MGARTTVDVRKLTAHKNGPRVDCNRRGAKLSILFYISS